MSSETTEATIIKLLTEIRDAVTTNRKSQPPKFHVVQNFTGTDAATAKEAANEFIRTKRRIDRGASA